jgi:hypothetical protein
MANGRFNAGTENILLSNPSAATQPGPQDSHIKDGFSGAYLADLAAVLTGNRIYTLQDADMTLAALNLAQYWTALQTFDSSIWVERYDDTPGNGCNIVGRRARGNSGGPTAVQSGDALLTFGGRGYGATGFSSMSRAAILMTAAENWSDSAQGAYLTLETTPTTSAVRVPRLKVGADGLIEILNTAPALRFTDSRSITWTGSEDLGGMDWYTSDASGGGVGILAQWRGIQVRASSASPGGGLRALVRYSTANSLLEVLRMVPTGTDTATATFYYPVTTTTVTAPASSDIVTDAATATVTEIATLDHESTGTPAAGFGARLSAYLESSTTARQLAGAWDWIWRVATHGAQSAYALLNLTLNGSTIAKMAYVGDVALANNTTTNLFEVALAANSGAGGHINFSVVGTNGTDHVVHTGFITYAVVDKAGTITSQITDTAAANDANAKSSGSTLTDTWSIVDGTDKITVAANFNSNMAGTTTWALHYEVHNGSGQQITIL